MTTNHADEVVAQCEDLQLGQVGQRSPLQSLVRQEVVIQHQGVEEGQVSEGLLTQHRDVVVTQR